jgi:GTP-binding protein
MFVDQVKVHGRAGHGGKGCVAFLRETFRPKGGPSGGNGGHGGNVILQADHDLNNLVAQFFTPRLIAEDGNPGLGKGMDGPAGKDLIIKVPCGTLVWRLPPAPMSPEEEEEAREEEEESAERAPMRASASRRTMIRHAGLERAVEFEEEEDNDPVERDEAGKERVADLTVHGQQFVLCKGGRGGLGNRNFATARRQTPRFAQPGEVGDEGDFLFELRTIADVGLVGFPNAGKSTLLTAVSRARPKVASYPFTTLHPQVGIMEFTDYSRLTVCDVPGLIDGAHLNVGLGHEFLRHIKRCKLLVLLLDMAGTDGRKPWDDYKQLLRELELYDPELLDKPRLVVANKMDEAASADLLKKFKRHVPKVPMLTMAAAFDQGTDDFKIAVRKVVPASQ